MVIELKSAKTRIFDAALVIICMRVFGVGEGVDWDCTPLPIRPKQYCDPASLDYI